MDFILILTNHEKTDVIILKLQLGKLSLREVKLLAQVHAAEHRSDGTEL